MPWITDAQNDGQLEESEIHQTQEIRKFLTRGNENYFILVASKGMGKTTLMRLKREQLQKSHDGITLIPFNSETDIVSLPSSVSNSIYKALGDTSYWRALWETSIMISVILSNKNSPELVARQRSCENVHEFSLPNRIVADLQSSLKGGQTLRQKPSEILDALLQAPKAQFELFRRSNLSHLTFIFRDVIASGCAVFIDSLDQELEAKFPGDLDIWRTGQLGLMRAAWELNRQNSHVKVFVSIRQEAWASFVDPVKRNMAGSTLIIKYTDSDLRQIFELLIKKNDKSSSIAEFFGFSTIHNHFIDQEESVFDFVRRHTLGVPRWFIALGSEVANIRDSRGIITDSNYAKNHQHAVADAINRESAEQAKDYLQSEMALFFKGVDPVKHVKNLLRPVQSTVLTLANITRLAQRYQALDAPYLDHPFCLLINLGLVGYSSESEVTPDTTIRFRMPYEFNWEYADILPRAPKTLYFLHPALHQLAIDNSAAFRFLPVRIGDKLPLQTPDFEIINARRFSIYISYSSKDWSTHVSQLVEGLEDIFNERGYFVDIWVDRRRMQGARRYFFQLTEGNRNSDFMIFCASRNSLKSEPVQDEIAQRKDMDYKQSCQTMFTVIIDDLEVKDLPPAISIDHVLMAGSTSFQVSDLADQVIHLHDELRLRRIVQTNID